MLGTYRYDFDHPEYPPVFYPNSRRTVLDSIIGMTTAEWNARNPTQTALDIYLVFGEKFRVVIDLARRARFYGSSEPFLIVSAKEAYSRGGSD